MLEFENTMENKIVEENQLIKNIELRNYVQFCLDKENVTLEDLDSINEIMLDSQNIVGGYNKVYFEEVALFKNLKKISIKNLGLAIDDLEKISDIKEIEFINCEIRDLSKLQNVEKLILNNSEIDNLEDLAQLSNIVQLQLVNMKINNFDFLKQLKKLEKLAIKNIQNFKLSEIDFYLPIKYFSVEKINELDLNVIEKFENLKILSVDRIEADNLETELNEIKNKDIKVLLNDMYEY